MDQKKDPTEPVLDTARELRASDDTSGEEALRAERDMLLDRLSRLQAEFENFTKRSGREQQTFREYALADAMRSLLPVLDSFDRALQVREQHPEQLRAGFELIQKQLQNVLSKLGVSPIAAAGEVFNPYLHQALEVVDANDSDGDRVVQELQPGYLLRGHLLRPAMVRVTRSRKSA